MAGLGKITHELSGIRVLEIGRSLPARLLVKLLADQGADIVCIALAGTNPPSTSWDDGRTSVAIGIDSDSGRSQLRDLIAGADIVIDSKEDRTAIGLDAGARQSFPRLIDLHFCAYPSQAGPQNESLDDQFLVAELGLNRAGYVFGQPPPPDEAPLPEPLAIPSTYGALFGALYLSLGLLERDRTGAGTSIEVPLFSVGMMALNSALAAVAEPALQDQRAFPTFRLPILDRYLCEDGRFFQLQGNTPTSLIGTLRGLGHDEWYSEAVKAIPYLATAGELASWRDRFASLLATAPAIEWEDRIARERGAGTLCRTRSEWVAEPQALDTGILVWSSDAPSRTGLALGPAVLVNESVEPQSRPIANELTSPAVDAAGRPLAGLKVLDLTVILAGPTIGRLLGEFGADVIKIDHADRATWPVTAPMIWLDVNRAKRSMIVDLKTEQGRQALWRLIDQADVFIENFREGRIAALGFDYEQIHKRNPRIVYLSANAFDFGGAFSDRPGWEPNAQAMTGMQTARSRPGEIRYLPTPINDYGTAVLGTYGVLLGLLAAHRSGQGRAIRVSLARTASLFQARELVWQSDVQDQDDLDAVTFPRVSDGWIMVPAEQRLDAATEQSILGLSRKDAVAALGMNGVRSAVVRTPRELNELEWVRDAGLITSWHHDSWGSVSHATAHAWSSSFEQVGLVAAPQPGEHTRAILEEIGYSSDEIDLLYEAGVVSGPLSLWGSEEAAEEILQRS